MARTNIFVKPFDSNKIIAAIKELLGITANTMADQYSKDIETALINRMQAAISNKETEFLKKLPIFLTDKKYSSSVRCQAAITIGVMKNEESAQYLLREIDDPDPMVREKIVWAIGELKIQRAFGKLKSILMSKEETIDVKMAAVLAISAIGLENEVKDLLDQVKAAIKDQRKKRRRK